MPQKRAAVKKRQALSASEVVALRKLLESKQDDDEEYPDEYDDPYGYYSYEPTAKENGAAAHVQWNKRLQERIEAIQECMRRGRHVTESSEAKPQPGGKLLVTMTCKCGACGRVVVDQDLLVESDDPPKEWT